MLAQLTGAYNAEPVQTQLPGDTPWIRSPHPPPAAEEIFSPPPVCWLRPRRRQDRLCAGRSAASESGEKPASPGAMRKIPIGVFDPAFPNLSLEEMIDKFAGWGVEAVEIGTGGYPNSAHCPVKDLLEDEGKARAWKKKFEDRGIQVATLSCHGNPVSPDPNVRDTRCRNFPTHRASRRAPGSEGDRRFFWLPRRQSDRHYAQLGDLPLASGVRQDARLAVEGEGHSVLEGGGQVRPRAWNPQDCPGDAPEFCGLQSR